MTIHDLRCDVCGRSVVPPQVASRTNVDAIRFTYHPGAAELRDDSGLACAECWDDLVRWLGMQSASHCARCGKPLSWRQSLHLRRFDDTSGWQLCDPHAAELLNRLRTVAPKFDPRTFRLPARPETPEAGEASPPVGGPI